MKTRATLFICLVLALALLTACVEEPATPNEAVPGSTGTAYQKITSADGKELLDNGAELILVDVRSAEEYETAHIPGALNVPNESINGTQPDALPELNKTVIVYCRTGVRSKQAADKLVGMGYTDVRDMGGIVDWPYDTISGTEPGEYA